MEDNSCLIQIQYGRAQMSENQNLATFEDDEDDPYSRLLSEMQAESVAQKAKDLEQSQERTLRFQSVSTSHFSREKMFQFLYHLSGCGLVQQAARLANISAQKVQAHRLISEKFAAAFDEAMDIYKQNIEAEIHRRAIDGWDEPVYQKGELCGTIHRHSDRLLVLLAKRHIAEYRDTDPVSSAGGGGVMVVPMTAQTAEAWEKAFGSKAGQKDGSQDE
jgi:hypothetical protein